MQCWPTGCIRSTWGCPIGRKYQSVPTRSLLQCRTLLPQCVLLIFSPPNINLTFSYAQTKSRIRVVQYNPYKHPRRFTECEIKQISVNGQPGASLKLALSNELVGLDCGSDTFFQASGPKFTYRIDVSLELTNRIFLLTMCLNSDDTRFLVIRWSPSRNMLTASKTDGKCP